MMQKQATSYSSLASHFQLKQLATLTMDVSFKELDHCKLTDVTVKGREIGRGAYAAVIELEYISLKCAGKKIHDLFIAQWDTNDILRRFEKECCLLSQVRHPNIVQFLGVYFEHGSKIPIMVMEFLPANLTSYIERYKILQKEMIFSILYDVALGLNYLHSQSPTIIHRDLSSNNILLTHNMMAKISDLGMARILNLTPQQAMTTVPGTPTYMPPEAMVASPIYSTSIDKFSYGILMIHLLCGMWPVPQLGPSRVESGELVPVSEEERRKCYLTEIGDDHPLMDLILSCINNDPTQRPCVSKIALRMVKMVEQYPKPYAGRMDLMQRIKALEDEKKALKEVAQAKVQVAEKMIEEVTTLTERKDTLLAETKMLEAERDNLISVNSSLQEKLDMAKLRHGYEIEAKDQAIKHQAESISKLNGQLAEVRTYLASEKQIKLTWNKCADLPSEMSNGKCTVMNEKVYFGGGMCATNDDSNFIVYCYDPPLDSWIPLPPLPTVCFGLGQIDGKLVAVGGRSGPNYTRTNEVYTFNEQEQKWKQAIPPMLIARSAPATISLKSALIVAGGENTYGDYTYSVDAFVHSSEQWHKCCPLPKSCANLSAVLIDNNIFMLGGFQGSNLNQALYASVDDILCGVKTTRTPSDPTVHYNPRSVWKMLPDTAAYRPAASAILGNSLLAIGGNKSNSKSSTARKQVCAYSSTANSWVYISDLPCPMASTATAVLSPTEILIIGGWDGSKLKTVVKGILTYL